MGWANSHLYMFEAAGATWGIAKSRVIKYVGVTFRNFATLPFDEGRCAAILGTRGRTLRSAANLSRKAGPLQIGRRAEFLPSVVENVYEFP